MRSTDIRIRRPLGIIRLALSCTLMAVFTDCESDSASGNNQTASLSNSTGQELSPALAAIPTVSLTASPDTVSSGSAATLTWSSTNATSCTASGGWSGSEPTSGSASTGALSATTSYTLTCSGSGGSASQSVTVNVTPVVAGGTSCSATSGGLTLQAAVVRKSGVSPLLAFFDATGTTSSAVTGSHSSFQDISYRWSFGDTGASGSGTWVHGAHAGHNSKNAATGAVAAHLYITNGADTTYPVTVTAYDGTNTASCSLGVTAYDGSGANGFPGTQTTCVYNSTLGSGCPAGANTLQTYSLSTALSSAFGSNKRVLFRCGDKFTGSYSIAATTNKATIGAYGGCENTTAGRPIFQNSSGTTLQFFNDPGSNPTDIRVADIDFEDGTDNARAIDHYVHPSGRIGSIQVVLYNLNCNGLGSCFYQNQDTQGGIIASTQTGEKGGIGTFWNYAENNCLNGSRALYCGYASYNPANYFPVWYNAMLGNSFDGTGANTGGGIETVRFSACRMCVITNNTFKNANPTGAVLKIHNGNTPAGGAWLGQYGEYYEISDNLFTGTSGTNLVEFAPQGTGSDERLRLSVFERNYILGTGASKVLISAVNVTARNNVFYVVRGNNFISDFNMQISRRGVEPPASAIEIYNNTCYALTTQSGCAGFISGDGTVAAGINSWAYNNLFYNNGSNSATVVNNGTGNTVSNNTTNSAANPLLINASGSLSLISDFQPTQYYSGGAGVPVWYDALGVAWSPTWNLGSLKP